MIARSGVKVVVASLAVIACWLSPPRPAQAQDFYAGKTILLYAGQPPGGGIDNEMRLVAQFLSRFIPGEPQIQPRNMPGAGGVTLGNYLYASTTADGLTLGMPGRAGFVLAPIGDDKIARYDVRRFTWIGSAASTNFIFWARNTSGLKSAADLKTLTREINVAGSGATTSNSIVPEILARYEKFPFKVVRGYPGMAPAVLSLERGETEAIFSDRASIRADMIASGLVLPLFQTFETEPGLPTIDTLLNDPRERELVGLLTTPMRLGLALIGPPGLAPAQTKTLRDAYGRMVRDPAYQEEARRRNFDVGAPNDGEALTAYLSKVISGLSPEVIAEYKSFVERN
ncbi:MULTISPECIES: tripartite tricarboxylate transporter substrate-binding protein [unclassified Beijerinckia]|uniref:Bug family tripartite tricarboxylate transporter substrate binding protein n=1 Tax=unclassified Beijerinckia TaxID=2638183 RepID=UPI00089D81CE|nr:MULTISPECIES: tripartite tricarboxylate transporter substrate-binding protein [unclassified Beijerinckia]MDH7798515.1 tripartite-type tricarboxylate transporter receptor subunit TctC [Beijerinckia sp. GAS462]SED23457.1 Tripartite-type tricarboxylate transporter, receptor component TctC [Beijerinckia sp. 28-YEA-48]